jgi:hypothetical protein
MRYPALRLTMPVAAAMALLLLNVAPHAGILAAYPQVYEPDNTKQINLYGSSVFRQRNQAFFNELAEKTRETEKIAGDSLFRGDVIVWIYLSRGGSVDSARVAECPMVSGETLERMVAGIRSWQFGSAMPSSTGRLLVVQKFILNGPGPRSGYKTKIPVIIIAALGVLLLAAGFR